MVLMSLVSAQLGVYTMQTTDHHHLVLGLQPCPKVRDPVRNVLTSAGDRDFDLLAFRQYVTPEAVVGTVGKVNGRAPLRTRRPELNPRPLAVRARGLNTAVFP
jgi:hypothetical protein